jgi:thiosulfate reductase cytochrome b subunit
VNVPGWIGIPGLRHSIGLARWRHLGADTHWLLNGLIFYILIFSTGHWQRLVPTSWDYVPGAISVALQYLSLDWPAETGWTAYNALQVFAYFFTVFIAAPAALLTGLGLSPALSTRLRLVSTPLSIQVARSLHFLIMIWFLVFI